MSKKAQFFTVTVLGCGSSGGVPRIGNIWGACDPKNPKNRRKRCSILIEAGREDVDDTTNILVDTGCDMREQLLGAGITHLDAVFYTHEHADHVHGIDDLRMLAIASKKRIEVYMAQACAKHVMSAFSYCFNTPAGSDYKPILNANLIADGDKTVINGAGGSIAIEAFLQVHGNINSLGFRIGDFAYSCDLSELSQSSYNSLKGIKLWLLDALRYKTHPCHLNVEQAITLIKDIGVPKAFLTNMHIDLDYEALCDELPKHIRPAYDGLQIKMNLK
jgi:phosphoribosyl 1,2-cyclic phosphate phosphodiesterase